MHHKRNLKIQFVNLCIYLITIVLRGSLSNQESSLQKRRKTLLIKENSLISKGKKAFIYVQLTKVLFDFTEFLVVSFRVLIVSPVEINLTIPRFETYPYISAMEAMQGTRKFRNWGLRWPWDKYPGQFNYHFQIPLLRNLRHLGHTQDS